MKLLSPHAPLHPQPHPCTSPAPPTHVLPARVPPVLRQVRDLARSKKYDVFVNLCDGAFDEDRAGQEVVDALER